uniref:Uncharacterized protein n=1 Tax=Rangifer tarandus platyrhynchus TaxID=3082113 RepID=A0ACB0F2C2_RANTA|nr:unnamed protein product [Rangifer tarandus platyrhynchus]
MAVAHLLVRTPSCQMLEGPPLISPAADCRQAAACSVSTPLRTAFCPSPWMAAQQLQLRPSCQHLPQPAGWSRLVLALPACLTCHVPSHI